MPQSIAFINPRVSTSNVGDFFIEDSVKRILDFDPETSIDIDVRNPLQPGDMERINRCDAAVIVGTNLWYRHVEKPGRWMITVEELKQIRIPFIPLGVGTTLHRGEKETFQFDDETLKLLQVIHDKCEVSSARDPCTFEVLKAAGLDNVEMTGCPTLYRSLKPEWTCNPKKSDDIVLTARKGQDANFAVIVRELQKRGKNLVIAAQKKNDLYCARRRFPTFRKGVDAVYDFDIKPYLDLVENSYGAIGWRLHGNMIHLAHGNPTMFFANCSRCRSFSEAFKLPCIYAEDKETIPKVRLIEAVDHFLAADYFSPFKEEYRKHYQEMASFLDANGLSHNLVKR